MPLLRASQLTHHIGTQVILDDASLQLNSGERVCLVGRNGSGKSTLLRMLAGTVMPDKGEIWRSPGLRVAMMEQELPQTDSETTVYDAVAEGIAELGALLREYHHLATAAGADIDLRRLEALQHDIEARDGWRYQQKIEAVLSRLSLSSEVLLNTLSGGWLRRVALARALVCDPDVLLLDEPTNHLDIAAIEWLENYLADYSGCVLFISHDRALIERLANRIVELDRGRLTGYEASYQRFLELRDHALQVEAEQNALFDKRLAEEERWIRQGIKARRTRNEGRVRALERLREERRQRLARQGSASMATNEAERSGKLVAELSHVSYSIGGRALVDDLSLLVTRGDKLALVGPNGSGKTTLLKLLIGELQPQAGSVRLGTKLQVAYFDQMRRRLDDDQTVVDIVGQGRDSITINGRDRHIMSYLADFLFSAERARSQLRVLSGGERARVLLACLFSQPANVLVMDEPTNDLDIETLELLEELLIGFEGTVLLVSHDRALVDAVATSCVVLDGSGTVREYVGGYSDAMRQAALEAPAAPQARRDSAPEKTVPRASERRTKLSYKLQRELEELPGRIEGLEKEIAEIQATVSAPGFYQGDHEKVASTLESLGQRQAELDQCMERWLELSEL